MNCLRMVLQGISHCHLGCQSVKHAQQQQVVANTSQLLMERMLMAVSQQMLQHVNTTACSFTSVSSVIAPVLCCTVPGAGDGSNVVGRESGHPDSHETWVTVERLQQGLCGVSRPHFFRGVATVSSWCCCWLVLDRHPLLIDAAGV
jgi:hypothetical protein